MAKKLQRQTAATFDDIQNVHQILLLQPFQDIRLYSVDTMEHTLKLLILDRF